MLLTLNIKNFALIADQTIEFSKGFNVLVGETGAGKSLILDALGFVLGDKASKLNLRTGENKMLVQAVFDNNSLEIVDWFEQNGIDFEDNIIITRTQNLEGKTECRVNGTIVPASAIKNLAPLLVDAYAQNENIELLKVKNHIAILDSYASDQILPLKNLIELHLQNIKDIEAQMSRIGGDSANRERELELLDYQIKDIESANLKDGEDDEIKSKLDKLSNYEKIIESVKSANSVLASSCESVSMAETALAYACRYDETLNALNTRLSSCKIELQDINDSLNEYLSDIDFDQAEFEALDARLEAIKLIKKKYGSTISDVFAYLQKIKTDYDTLLFSEERLLKLQKQKEQEIALLYDICCKLSKIRRDVATTIENNVMHELAYLGFKNALFKIGFENLPDQANAVFTKNGLDNIEFLLSANAGESLKSLSKTISGGEMSRFMLALKNVFAKCLNPSTLVFDEVDTGISGEIGQKVAERLACLAKTSQLICITHLCQVTAMADKYIFVSKAVEQGKTFTNIEYLTDENVIKYIAVVSGAEPTQVAISFATELKAKAELYKQQL